MRNKVLASMLLAFLPWLAMAQSNDDLYFIPKKENKVENTDKVGVVPKEVSNKTVHDLPESVTPVVVKDVKGNVRNVDEYNRRYTSRDNKFSYQNDTLVIEEKPYGERGEWVNGFQGSQMDYEYAMRIVRFRNPRYAIPISSPLYWDAVYGAFPSWDWNVYDDGLYAYVFPTYTNSLWWDWRWSSGFYGPGWGWYSPYYYSSWYSPWYGGYWGYGGHWGFGGYWGGGYWAGYWGPGWHNPYYGWGGGWHRPVHYSYNTRKAEIGMPGRTSNRFSSAQNVVSNRNNRIGRTFDNNGRTGGRVVTSSRNSSSSVRTQSGVRGSASGSGVYTRPSRLSERDNTATYNRPSSTRVNSNRYNNYNNNRYNTTNNKYNNSNRYNNNTNVNRVTTTHSFGGSSYRSTTTSGGSSRSVGTSGGGGARRR